MAKTSNLLWTCFSPLKDDDDKTPFMLNFKNKQSNELVEASIFAEDDKYRAHVVELLTKKKMFSSPSEDRAFGALYGMVVGDVIGGRLEFDPVRYGTKTLLDMGEGPGGQFNLLPGQWTDDSSMGFCVADSFLCNQGEWKPHDCMQRFMAWYFCGLNNAFRFQKNRCPPIYFDNFSIGLGHRIDLSFQNYIQAHEAYTSVEVSRNDSSNGSIMRLAPLPVALHSRPLSEAEDIAWRHSKITHGGDESAGCCVLLTHIIVRLIRGENIHAVLSTLGQRPTDPPPTPAVVPAPAYTSSLPSSSFSSFSSSSSSSSSTTTTSTCAAADPPPAADPPCAADSAATGFVLPVPVPSVVLLARSECEKLPSGADDPDHDWRWRTAEQYRYSPARVKRDPTTVGGLAMDATCMALNIAWRASIGQLDPSAAILTAVNLCGDADSVGSVTGQLVGAAYGVSALPREWIDTVAQWDHYDTGLRAFRLFHKLWMH